jgi:uncharacterized integral membrane protein
VNSDGHDGQKPSPITFSRVIWGLLALIAIILLFQNSNSTPVHFLFWTITAPLWVVILAALLIGWGLGELGTRTWRWHRERNRKSD